MFALKMDLSKAYDQIEWKYLLKVMSCMDFSQKCQNSIYQCLSSSSFQILTNGSPGQAFSAFQGLRQESRYHPTYSYFVPKVSPQLFKGVELWEVSRAFRSGDKVQLYQICYSLMIAISSTTHHLRLPLF